jgi:selenide,water dikinase
MIKDDVHVGAKLNLNHIPVLPGALELMAQRNGASSLAEQNEKAGAKHMQPNSVFQTKKAMVALLSDPQTSGGLLAVVPRDKLQRCLEELHKAGYSHAACIGELSARGESVIELVEE